MKPKAAQKAKPKPLPAVAPSLTPAAESEPNPPPPQPRSPSLHPTRPSSPVMADISMESIVPAVDANPVMEVTPDVAPSKSSDSVQVIGPSLASHDTVAESSDSMTVTAPAVQPEPDPSGNSSLDHYIGNDSEMPRDAGVNNVDKAVLEPIAPVTEAPTTITEAPLEQKPVDLPKKKLTTRKVHVSKRMPTSIPGPNRITRSASLKRNQMVVEVPKALPSNFSSKKSLVKSSSSASLEPEIVASSSSSKLAEDASPDTAMSTPTPDIPAEAVTADSISQGSPMRLDSPTKKTAKTPKSSFAQPTKSALAKQVSPTKPTMSKSRNSSPNKIGRSASMISRSRASLSRTFTSYSNLEGSSLSTLSSALEKLQQRPPERPNTSMGFNREDPDTSIELKSTSQDDTSVTQISALKATSSSSQGVGSSRLVQRTLFGGRSSLTGKSAIGSSGTMMRGTGGFKMPGKTGKLFGVGSSGVFTGAMRRTVQKASRKTSLPSVMASPVKGAHADDAMDIADDNDHPSGDSPADLPADSLLPLNDKGKGKEPVPQTWESAASRRVSLASQALSQSLIASSAKPPPGIGLMGPPATPKGRKARSTSSNYPSSSSSGGETTRPETPTRSSLRLAKSASESGSSGSKAAPAAPALIRPEPLKILKDCVIFVDVRNDDGEEVGSLFVEMLEGLGARILTRVGQTCTHIVFKNGLSSTINRYRLLRDPKPHVVGIAWVVDCVEQRSQVDETKFIVDLDGINFSGTTNKRRRSLLPKLISHHFEENTSSDVEGDISMDGSTSCDDDLTPLERARLRKASAR
ncbi:hypothetical protein H0H92_010762 [Tricholoma furcatifolium]|nr:hypothetical protein H0H92_010762 [Tricholoma furcatifolium]